MNNKKLAIIIYKKSEQKTYELVNELNKLLIPNEYSVGIVLCSGRNAAIAYNSIASKIDAKYRIYIYDDIVRVSPRLIMFVLENFIKYPETGLLGNFGSTLPLNGDITSANKYYGMYAFTDEKQKVRKVVGKNPLFYQEVYNIDSHFFATSIDFKFDEELDNLYVADLCCQCRKMQKKIIVPMQNNPVMLCSETPDLMRFKNNEKYIEELRQYYNKNIKILNPLVSILIPTYNSPKFFVQALESAINQEYPNIEIIVGDDSTNDETEILMKKYLNRYSNITYYHHKKTIRDNGGKNMKFLLEKANGEYINLLFHDDLIYPSKIKTMMDIYIQDINNEVGLVTSVRDLINSEGENIGDINPWIPANNERISGIVAGRMILSEQMNYIGEHSTVLLRKEDLKISDNRYAIGIFCDYKDNSMGDISSWLNILKGNRKLAFIQEKLSAFRRHEKQNTFKPEIQINSLIDWLCFITVSYNNKVFIKKAEYQEFVDCWSKRQYSANVYLLNKIDENKLDDELKNKFHMYKKLVELAMSKKYDEIYQITNQYVKENSIEV